jgi:hypothetical protein
LPCRARQNSSAARPAETLSFGLLKRTRVWELPWLMLELFRQLGI